ncbi:MAG: hypothetical protein CSA53_04450 [Gammaproteobacteria bacterium]|nr:MAG: hypothetical protein CSA53_04450 [Gammaproteobacteria bacterium]
MGWLRLKMLSRSRLPRLSLALVLLCALSVIALQTAELFHTHGDSASPCLLCSADSGAALNTATVLVTAFVQWDCAQCLAVEAAHPQYRSTPPVRAPPVFS